MKISFDRKTVALSIGEFAGFTTAPEAGGDGRGGGLWRARVGTAWHDQLRAQSEEAIPGARFEMPIAGRWPHRDWIVELQGRADQVLPEGDGFLLREVKTVSTSLPASEDELRHLYPAYFRQLATYRALFPFTEAGREADGKPPGAELFFLEIETGLTQRVPLGANDDAAFQAQVERLVDFLQLRSQHLQRLRHLSPATPFSEPRPGQEEISQHLAEAAASHSVLLFQAPTGFGKTGYLLELALNQLRTGLVTRIVYLTGKSTGQLQVLHQLRAMLPEDAPISAAQVRNKRDHCINDVFHCFRESCAYLDDLENRWSRSELGARALSERRDYALETLREDGRRAGICPYEITRATLPAADIWIGDYNYVFSPSNRSFFYERPGFDPSQTILIVDEAHNLPSRAADNYSTRFTVEAARDVLTEFTFQAVPPAVKRAWEWFVERMAALRPCERCDPETEDHLAEAVRTLAEQVQITPPDYAALSPETLQRLDEAAALQHFMENPDIEKLLWVPRPGQIEATCLDASKPLGKTLSEFRTVALASATFGPEDLFLRQCGVNPDSGSARLVGAAAPWRAGAYDLAIDLRADTRYRQRERSTGVMAETIARVHARAQGPVVVFFPSYRYARDLKDAVEDRFPEIRVALQERRESLAEQTAFIEESLLLSDALFLILGSSYTESIDLLGGRVKYALIAGPALPEVNPVQNARMEAAGADHRDQRFREVYQIPGMRKVNQAIGRLARAPGHRARILLQCRRFAEPSYLDLLPPDLPRPTLVATGADLEDWLDNPSGK